MTTPHKGLVLSQQEYNVVYTLGENVEVHIYVYHENQTQLTRKEIIEEALGYYEDANPTIDFDDEPEIKVISKLINVKGVNMNESEWWSSLTEDERYDHNMQFYLNQSPPNWKNTIECKYGHIEDMAKTTGGLFHHYFLFNGKVYYTDTAGKFCETKWTYDDGDITFTFKH